MAETALIISILALVGTGISLFLQKAAHDREKRKEERDTKKDIRFDVDYTITQAQDYSIGRGHAEVNGVGINLKAFNIGSVNILIDKVILLDKAERTVLELSPYQKEYCIIEPGVTEYFRFYISNLQEKPFLLVYEERAKLLIIDHENKRYLKHTIPKFSL